jgi:hypothetical protein
MHAVASVSGTDQIVECFVLVDRYKLAFRWCPVARILCSGGQEGHLAHEALGIAQARFAEGGLPSRASSPKRLAAMNSLELLTVVNSQKRGGAA